MCKNEMCQHLTLDSFGWHKPCNIGEKLDSIRNAFIPASTEEDGQPDLYAGESSIGPIHQVREEVVLF